MWSAFLDRTHAWLSDLGPNRDAHNERIKLFATSLNGVGLACLIGGVVGPALDPSRGMQTGAIALGIALWAGFSFAAYRLLHYIQPKG
jgi:hypothetical protein